MDIFRVKKSAHNPEKKPELGVPNNFPYKDRVLAELAEEKRRVCG